MDSNKLTGIMILEILGRPKETIEGALRAVVDKLSNEKGVKIIKTDFHETKPVENAKDLFTTFVEIELEFDSLEVYYYTLFAYMPSHVEIINPQNVNLTIQHLNEFGNKLIQKLHDYEAIVQRSLNEKDFLTKKLFEVAPHLFKQSPMGKPVSTPNSSPNKEDTKVTKSSKKKSKKSNKKKN